MKQVQDSPPVQPGAFDEQNSNGRLDMTKFVEAEANGTPATFLSTRRGTQILDCLASLREIGFESIPTSMWLKRLDQVVPSRASGITRQEIAQFGELQKSNAAL